MPSLRQVFLLQYVQAYSFIQIFHKKQGPTELLTTAP